MFARSLSLLGLALAVAGLNAEPGIRVVVAQSNSPAAAFSARPANGTVFQALPDKAELSSGDMLVSLPGATLTSKNGAVAVRTLADFDSRSPLPVLDTGYSLVSTAEKDIDLELVLDRGRITVTNVKPDGPATVRLRFWDQNWKVVLDAPKTQVTLELSGRWTAGTRFRPADPNADPAKAPAPVATALFLVLTGSASVDRGGVTVAMRAPPGPAELRWNSLTGTVPQPQRLEKIPQWADPEANLSAEGQKVAGACERFRNSRAGDGAAAFETYLTSTEPVNQRVALLALCGLDDLERLEKSLATAKTQEQWDFGVTVLRHWLGRTRGHDQQLYQHLTARGGYTESQARIVLQLLLGFTPEDLAQPETFEVLIDYLGNPKPSVRSLAAWHLVRLVPQGKALAYKPTATEAEARLYQQEWKKIIPPGQLPGAVKKP
ncbi:Uncharacterized protein OS=Planctomyces limnophilus (strain ATCC 43296 / DSM 3776 / IFAM 1008 / 290) GN=Plim_3407 PE=4 SV=1 [Gemmataceae bacterium]|nr:Uncharacterized protein OS=Planctomyces limnophilus (strain ATCC 43296 / DSM 3776 / IFAM 1008 / 290) GN=Plim_3407 PE=4 SV=1 [Gemmataceae bacterium]VTT98414.1 Uncharacterized protein OS=Planctomyces limnophilus (strain ATCC 43296 / DSM 3776 / IFAM 1008 / 290) GN=Plim_3407 PE=4 SV=1 [Gemmataceae bacterium]